MSIPSPPVPLSTSQLPSFSLVRTLPALLFLSKVFETSLLITSTYFEFAMLIDSSPPFLALQASITVFE